MIVYDVMMNIVSQHSTTRYKFGALLNNFEEYFSRFAKEFDYNFNFRSILWGPEKFYLAPCLFCGVKKLFADFYISKLSHEILSCDNFFLNISYHQKVATSNAKINLLLKISRNKQHIAEKQ